MAIQPSDSSQISAPLPQTTPGGARFPAETDAELVRQMAVGDEEAFAAFYDRFGPVLFSMLCTILRDEKESEDVLQEAFALMWKRASAYDAAQSSLFAWAVMIARHKAIERLRSRLPRARLSEALGNIPDLHPVAAAVVPSDNALERDGLQAVLNQLGEGQREAVELAFFGGLTQTELVEKVGAPLETVRARIRRGLLAVRETVGKRAS